MRNTINAITMSVGGSNCLLLNRHDFLILSRRKKNQVTLRAKEHPTITASRTLTSKYPSSPPSDMTVKPSLPAVRTRPEKTIVATLAMAIKNMRKLNDQPDHRTAPAATAAIAITKKIAMRNAANENKLKANIHNHTIKRSRLIAANHLQLLCTINSIIYN